MKVLITGGAGLIGHSVIDQINRKEHDVVIVDKLLYADDYLRNDSKFYYGDVSDEDFMVPFLKKHKFDAVIHLAAIVGDGACQIRSRESREVNVNSVEILSKYFDGRIIFPSSCSVYGVNPEEVTEESPLNPLSLYAATKVEAERLLKEKNAIILRLGTLHGMTYRIRNDLVVNLLTIRALTEGKMSVFGGDQYRPLLQVGDIATLMIQLLDNPTTGVYNVAEGNYTISAIAERIKSQLHRIGIKSEIEHTEVLFEDHRDYRVNLDKLRTVPDITLPRTPVEDTVVHIAWLHKTGRVKDFFNARYSNVNSASVS